MAKKIPDVAYWMHMSAIYCIRATDVSFKRKFNVLFGQQDAELIFTRPHTQSSVPPTVGD
jgi:hypothetical protein